MSLTPTVTAACGLRIACRGAGRSPARDQLTVGPIADVELPSSRSLEARSPEGELWRRLWSLPDRLVLELIGVAAVEAREADGTIVFDRELPPDVEDHVVLDHVLPLWLARRGHLVLHGAMLVRQGRAAVLTGHSGVGKSTLTAVLGDCGWLVGGDDATVVRIEPRVTAEATYPTIRLPPEATGLLGLPADAGVRVAGKRRLDPPPGVVTHGPGKLAVVARINPVDQPEASFDRLHGASALNLLLTNAFHVDLGSNAHLSVLMDGLVRVAESVIVGELSVPRGRDGLAAAERVLADVVAE